MITNPPPKPKTSPPIKTTPHHPPPSTQTRSGPPALGMRPKSNYSSVNKPKGFKSPVLKKSTLAPEPQVTAPVIPAAAPPDDEDTDTSYDFDTSFDMDELESVMKEYD